MTSLFVDTAGWANLYIPTENCHAEAAEIFQRARQHRQQLVTTNYIIAELVALLDRPLRTSRPRLFTLVDSIRRAPFVEIVHITPEVEEEAWSLCKSRPDKQWSLVDCTSFMVMSREGILEALTTDHHFEQAGFIRLLKPSTGR